jgi:hypothetical protein
MPWSEPRRGMKRALGPRAPRRVGADRRLRPRASPLQPGNEPAPHRAGMVAPLVADMPERLRKGDGAGYGEGVQRVSLKGVVRPL